MVSSRSSSRTDLQNALDDVQIGEAIDIHGEIRFVAAHATAAYAAQLVRAPFEFGDTHAAERQAQQESWRKDAGQSQWRFAQRRDTA